MTDHHPLLRQLPAIDRLLNTPPLKAMADSHAHAQLRAAAQAAVEELRRRLLAGEKPLPDLAPGAVARLAVEFLHALETPSLRRVLNLTGTVLHTNLGRAPLAQSALQAVVEVARGYSTLEYELGEGRRGERHVHVEELLCRLTGAEAALAVNNNAGAVLLALAALAGGKSALVSRGELIEIGGSFRIPEIMAAGGVRLVEVGTTNKTHLDDYRRAIGDGTALILKVHTSNYRILGFTSTVTGEELAALGRERGLPVLEDLGSGLLLDPAALGLPREPTVREALATGIDAVTFSGDKLLGGPQAGVIAGRQEIIARLKHHPLARALRLDKMTLAALEATLRLYLDPQRALREIPALGMLAIPAEELLRRCRELLPPMQAVAGDRADLEIIPATATVGGGAMPLAELPGFALAVTPHRLSLQQLAARLRRSDPPVVGRTQDNRLLLDPRTLLPGEEPLLTKALGAALAAPSHD
ncbi:MAG: L-seryl-tRNA(Sec) selenium transferase [Deltaproteobacteria bacterium]|nr:MAG: L-seryl-tRNA(Sec) selenium transferase [Deltaproteobacteria bacterium]